MTTDYATSISRTETALFEAIVHAPDPTTRRTLLVAYQKVWEAQLAQKAREHGDEDLERRLRELDAAESEPGQYMDETVKQPDA